MCTPAGLFADSSCHVPVTFLLRPCHVPVTPAYVPRCVPLAFLLLKYRLAPHVLSPGKRFKHCLLLTLSDG